MGFQGFAFVAKGIGRPLPRHVTIPVKSSCRNFKKTQTPASRDQHAQAAPHETTAFHFLKIKIAPPPLVNPQAG
jgi:hypothetical protein